VPKNSFAQLLRTVLFRYVTNLSQPISIYVDLLEEKREHPVGQIASFQLTFDTERLLEIVEGSREIVCCFG
jgi:hypothetical protein